MAVQRLIFNGAVEELNTPASCGPRTSSQLCLPVFRKLEVTSIFSNFNSDVDDVHDTWYEYVFNLSVGYIQRTATNHIFFPIWHVYMITFWHE